MRIVIGAMVGFYVVTFWIFPAINQFIFPWGGVSETHLHPIYMGMILLAGLIVMCTQIVLEEIKELKEEKASNNLEK